MPPEIYPMSVTVLGEVEAIMVVAPLETAQNDEIGRCISIAMRRTTPLPSMRQRFGIAIDRLAAITIERWSTYHQLSNSTYRWKHADCTTFHNNN